MGEFIYDKNVELEQFFDKYPQIMHGTAEEIEMTREEVMEHYWKKIKLINELEPKWITQNSELLDNMVSWNAAHQHTNPLTLH